MPIQHNKKGKQAVSSSTNLYTRKKSRKEKAKPTRKLIAYRYAAKKALIYRSTTTSPPLKYKKRPSYK